MISRTPSTKRHPERPSAAPSGEDDVGKDPSAGIPRCVTICNRSAGLRPRCAICLRNFRGPQGHPPGRDFFWFVRENFRDEHWFQKRPARGNSRGCGLGRATIRLIDNGNGYAARARAFRRDGRPTARQWRGPATRRSSCGYGSPEHGGWLENVRIQHPNSMTP